MSARKPSSVFVITALPTATDTAAGLSPSQHTCWRIPLNGEDPATVAKRHLGTDLGAMYFVFEDTKATVVYGAHIDVEELDEVRLLDADGEPLI